jgi:hypothetical protein
MYPEYEESGSIIELTTQCFKIIKENISRTETIQDMLYSVRILHDILQFRRRFLDHVSHGGSRTGFNFESEQSFYRSGEILLQGSKGSLEDSRKSILESLNRLISCLQPFSSLHLLGKMPKWKYHHPRKNAAQYFYSYAHKDYISEKALDFFKGTIPYQIKFWVDRDDLRRFHKLPEELSKAINKSQAAILMLSQNYLKSKWCSHEWQSAIERNIHEEPPMRLYVVMIDNCEMPALLKPYYRTNLIGLPSPEPFLELMKLIDDILDYEMLAR